MLVVNHINRANGKVLSWPLYQWDKYQWVEIRGLSLPSTPEVHFTNVTMSRAIVQQATMDKAGVIVVKVPNSLLQKPYPITAFVCTRDGDAFKSMCQFEIPVKARPQPAEYTFEYDNEVYSFEALENLIKNNIDPAQAAYYQAKIEARSAKASAEAWQKAAQETMQNYNKIVTLLENFTNIALLWENETLSVAPALIDAQIDTTEYGTLLLQWYRSTTADMVDNQAAFNTLLVVDTEVPQEFGYSEAGWFYSRKVTIADNLVNVSACTGVDNDGNSMDAGNHCVPYRIYGIR